jgi:hypothetical protein
MKKHILEFVRSCLVCQQAKPDRVKYPGLLFESAFIPFVSFGDLDNNTFKVLTSLLSVEHGIQYDEHT